MLHRFDIVNIPERLRAGMPARSVMEFPAETAISILEFRPDDFVRRISPKPLLLVHPKADDVLPKSESEYLASLAGEPCELHITESNDHFASGDPVLHKITLDWLFRYLPPES